MSRVRLTQRECNEAAFQPPTLDRTVVKQGLSGAYTADFECEQSRRVCY